MTDEFAIAREEIMSMTARLAQQIAPSCDAILYGSTASNRRRQQSDVDLLVLLDIGDSAYRERRVIAGFAYDIAVVSYGVLPDLIRQARSRQNRYFDKIASEGIVVAGNGDRFTRSVSDGPEASPPISSIQLRASLASLLADLPDAMDQLGFPALVFEAYRMLVASSALAECSEFGPTPILVEGLPSAKHPFLVELNAATRRAMNGQSDELLELVRTQLQTMGGPPAHHESFPLL
jgi:predicted nucleotidyltransferase